MPFVRNALLDSLVFVLVAVFAYFVPYYFTIGVALLALLACLLYKRRHAMCFLFDTSAIGCILSAPLVICLLCHALMSCSPSHSLAQALGTRDPLFFLSFLLLRATWCTDEQFPFVVVNSLFHGTASWYVLCLLQRC